MNESEPVLFWRKIVGFRNCNFSQTAKKKMCTLLNQNLKNCCKLRENSLHEKSNFYRKPQVWRL